MKKKLKRAYALSFLDRDFYHVEKDDNGNTIIHDNGYCYVAEDGYGPDGKVSEKYRYRLVEFCGLYLDPSELKKDDGYYDVMQGEAKQYIEDITERECYDILTHWLCGAVDIVENGVKKTIYRGCKMLPLSEVTDDTPEGWYADVPASWEKEAV